MDEALKYELISSLIEKIRYKEEGVIVYDHYQIVIPDWEEEEWEYMFKVLYDYSSMSRCMHYSKWEVYTEEEFQSLVDEDEDVGYYWDSDDVIFIEDNEQLIDFISEFFNRYDVENFQELLDSLKPTTLTALIRGQYCEYCKRNVTETLHICEKNENEKNNM